MSQTRRFTRRIQLGFSILILIAVLLGLATVFAFQWLERATAAMHAETVRGVANSLRMDAAGEKEAANARGFLITGEEGTLSEMTSANREFHQLLAEAFRFVDDDEGRRLLDSLNERERSEQESVDRAIALKLRSADPRAIRAIVEKELRSKYSLVDEATERFVSYTSARAASEQSQMAQTSARLLGLFRGIGLTAIALALALGALVAHTLRQIRKAEGDLVSALQSRDEFLSIASHELKTPLTSLSLQLELLQRSGSVPGIDACARQCRRLAALLGELLDLTRIRAGKIELHRESVELVELVRGAIARQPAEAGEKARPISFEAEPAEIHGFWDPMRLEQIVTNLVSNAIKYGGGSPIEVHLRAETGARKAVLSVRDHGMGIPAELQDKIFERFERASPKSLKIKGLGLGLYIVRQLVEAHGGSIRVESQAGAGAVFRVELRCQPRDGPTVKIAP